MLSVLAIQRKEAAQFIDQELVVCVLLVGVGFDIQVPTVDKGIAKRTGCARGCAGICVGVPESKCDTFCVGLGSHRTRGILTAYADEDFLARRLAGLNISC